MGRALASVAVDTTKVPDVCEYARTRMAIGKSLSGMFLDDARRLLQLPRVRFPGGCFSFPA